MTAVIMKAQKNRPVLSTTNPVTTGAIHPARLAKKFCSPVHLPAASLRIHKGESSTESVGEDRWIGVFPDGFGSRPRENDVRAVVCGNPTRFLALGRRAC